MQAIICFLNELANSAHILVGNIFHFTLSLQAKRHTGILTVTALQQLFDLAFAEDFHSVIFQKLCGETVAVNYGAVEGAVIYSAAAA